MFAHRFDHFALRDQVRVLDAEHKWAKRLKQARAV
jgi:hypothetical protein